MRQHMGQNGGQAMAPGSIRVATDFFVYSTLLETLPGNGAANTSIQIEADSNFEIQKLTAFSDSSTDPQSLNTSTVIITDTGSGRQLMDIALPIPNLFGTGELPFILPNPKIVFARSTLAFTFAKRTAGDISNITLSLIGRKIFNTGM